MNRRPPKLRRTKRGYYFVRWGGRDHYFGTREHAQAHELYLVSLQDWARWRRTRDTKQRFFPMTRVRLVGELAVEFLRIKEVYGGDDLRQYYMKHLRRFLAGCADLRADLIRPQHVQTLKDDMVLQRYASKTINHDLTAVKAMLRWAAGLEYIPPISLNAVRSMPLGPPPDKTMSHKAVKAMVEAAADPLRSWLALNYLCLMRPTEVIRVAHQQGDWVEEGVFRLDRGKTDKKARYLRHIIFSPAALAWLPGAAPVYSRLDSYSQAVRRVCGPGGPHPLRHSAATHLHQAGATVAEIDLLLGHLPRRVTLTYVRIEWQPLRRTAALLSL